MNFHLFRRTLLIAFVLLLTIPAFNQSQELYLPRQYQKSYENGTRKWDGSVSKTYRQNRAKYAIKAVVNPTTRILNATATIIYYQEFSTPLRTLGFHAYKDHYNEGMIVKKLKVAGKPLDLNDAFRIQKSKTHYAINLSDNPLKKGDSISIEIDWSITIPKEVDRDGAYDASSMFVAYWYPEMAVYDDIFGWDNLNFNGGTEFYHDVSAFDVEIEIPKNFVLWASAAPINGDDVYPEVIQKRLKKAKNQDEKVTIISPKDLEKGLEMKSNVWKYSVDSFPDFSFAFSDHYLWEACTYTDRYGEYFLNSAYPEKNSTFELVLDIEKEAIESFHTEFPVYPFPFRHFVAFNGETGGGMEFAGMCNDAVRQNYFSEGVLLSDYESNKLLTYHEMMHMYFPFLMGINEKRYAWMDEGMAEFSEDQFAGVNLESYEDRSSLTKSTIPPMMVETHTAFKASGVNSYDLSSQSYYALMHLLGKKTFDQCMKTYINRWKYKHPSPYDFFFTFNNVSGQNLNWFWNAWYFDWGYPDVGIKSFEGDQLQLENPGGRPMAVKVEITNKDGNKTSQMINPLVWKDATTYLVTVNNPENVSSIELKTLNGPDPVQENNRWDANAVIK